MKIKQGMLVILIGLICGTALSTFTFSGRTQQAQPNFGNNRNRPVIPSHPNLGLPVDIQTWVVISPDGDQSRVAHLNTPELIQQRALAALAIEHPEQFVNLIRQTPEERQAADEAIFAILNPVENSARQRQNKTPQQLQQEAMAALPVLNPRLYQQTLGEPPPLRLPGQNP